MNGTENAESGKLVKTLYMHMRELLAQSEDNIMCGVDTPGIFVMNIEQDHVYSILIESVDSKALTVRNKRYTVANDTAHNKRVCINVRINDYNEDVASEDYIADYSILKLVAWGSEPNIYKTVRIMDITEEDHSVHNTDTPDDETIKLPKVSDDPQGCMSEDDKQKVMLSPFQKSLLRDISSPKSSESNSSNTETMEDTCDNNDTDKPTEDHNNDGLKQDIQNLLHDVNALRVKLINVTDSSALIKYYIETHANSIGDDILKNEVRLLNTYLSSIGNLYEKKLSLISQNIKDTLKL